MFAFSVQFRLRIFGHRSWVTLGARSAYTTYNTASRVGIYLVRDPKMRGSDHQVIQVHESSLCLSLATWGGCVGGSEGGVNGDGHSRNTWSYKSRSLSSRPLPMCHAKPWPIHTVFFKGRLPPSTELTRLNRHRDSLNPQLHVLPSYSIKGPWRERYYDATSGSPPRKLARNSARYANSWVSTHGSWF